MASPVLQPGFYSNYFIVAHDDAPYRFPEEGAELRLSLRGRIPSRYAEAGINDDLAVGADEEGIVIVRRFTPWDLETGPGGVIRFEGYIREPESMHVQGTLAFGSLNTPPGILKMLSYDGLDSELRRELTRRDLPPLGTLRLS